MVLRLLMSSRFHLRQLKLISNMRSYLSVRLLIYVVVFFDYPDISCTGFPGPGADHYITLNPMQEFVHHIDEHTKTMFMQFKEKHSKKYVHKEEHANRENIFRQNIRSVNRSILLEYNFNAFTV